MLYLVGGLVFAAAAIVAAYFYEKSKKVAVVAPVAVTKASGASGPKA